MAPLKNCDVFKKPIVRRLCRNLLRLAIALLLIATGATLQKFLSHPHSEQAFVLKKELQVYSNTGVGTLPVGTTLYFESTHPQFAFDGFIIFVNISSVAKESELITVDPDWVEPLRDR